MSRSLYIHSCAIRQDDVCVTCIAYIAGAANPTRKSFVITGKFDFSGPFAGENFADPIPYSAPSCPSLSKFFYQLYEFAGKEGTSRHRSLRVNRKFAKYETRARLSRCALEPGAKLSETNIAISLLPSRAR